MSSKQSADSLINPQKVEQEKGSVVLIKYGGNAMVEQTSKENVIADIRILKENGLHPVIVHGGGPAIKQLLGDVGKESEFIGGHRKTDEDAMGYVEMALSGNVNGEIVKLLNNAGCDAVGITGKDGNMVTAVKRHHEVEVDGKQQVIDLGHVGNVSRVNTRLIKTLLENDYIPVIAPIGFGEDLKDYNINADMFAGHLAGALQVDHFILLTDVDGLMADIDDPDSIIRELTTDQADNEMGRSIQGGMIPKVESCIIALKEGVHRAHIVNGMRPNPLTKAVLGTEPMGTLIVNKNESAD